jgi:hypothetical protein
MRATRREATAIYVFTDCELDTRRCERLRHVEEVRPLGSPREGAESRLGRLDPTSPAVPWMHAPMTSAPAHFDLYRGYRFPAEVISHAVWLYARFALSYRDVEELLAERGIHVSYETVRRWVGRFGERFTAELRSRERRPGRRWHLDDSSVACSIEWGRHRSASGRTSWPAMPWPGGELRRWRESGTST